MENASKVDALPLSGFPFLSSLSLLSPWSFLLFPAPDLSWMLMWEMNYWVMLQMLDSLLCHVYRFTLKWTFVFSRSPSLCPSPSAKESEIKTNPPYNLTEDNVILLTLWPLWLCVCVCERMFIQAFSLKLLTRLYITYVTNSIFSQHLFNLFFHLLFIFSVLSHICGIMLEDGRSNQEEVVNLSSYLFGRQVAERWPCKSYWHWGDIHLVYPYSRSPCPFMKTCAICHRVSPWLCSLINLSMWDGGDLLAQHLSGLEPRDTTLVLAKKSRNGYC